MIKSKVIDSLKSLSKQELKELSDFIISPCFNKNKNVIKMFAGLKKFYPDFTSRNMTKEFVYSKVFPGKKYADKTFRNLISDILKLVEKYFALKSLSEDKLLEKRLLVKSLSAKNLISSAERALRDADKLFDNALFDGGNVFFTKHLIEMEKDFLEISKNNLITLNMKEGEYIIYVFLSKYMLFKMKLAGYRQKLGTQKTSEFIDEFEKNVNLDSWMKRMESSENTVDEVILIYYYAVKFMSDPSDDNSFNKALKMFYRNKVKIDATETANLYITFTGYCAVKLAKGENQYAEILFNLYERMFDENLLMGKQDKYLHITIYNNVVTLGLRLGKMEWTKSFIEKYSPHLLPELRDSLYNYSYSWYYFSAGEFEKSLGHLSKVILENYWLKSRTRILQLRLYYELNHVESFFSQHDSVKHYIKSYKEMPEYGKQNDYAFISLLNRLAKIKFAAQDGQNHGEKTAEIEAETRQSLNGPSREWILAKIREINA